MSYTTEHLIRQAQLRDDLASAIGLLRQLGPRGPQDTEWKETIDKLREWHGAMDTLPVAMLREGE